MLNAPVKHQFTSLYHSVKLYQAKKNVPLVFIVDLNVNLHVGVAERLVLTDLAVKRPG